MYSAGMYIVNPYILQPNLLAGLKLRAEADGGTFEQGCANSIVTGLADIGLWNEAKLLLTPNAYKSGVVYAAKPGANGDLTWARTGATATRVNPDLEVEDIATGVPRIDYPLDGSCPSILLEPARTNVYPYSEDYSQADWVKVAGGSGSIPVITGSYAVSPDGTTNASRVQFECGGTSSSDYSRLYDTLALDGSSEYSQSIYIKSNTGASQDLLFFTQSSNGDAITATTEWVRLDTQVTSNTTSGRHFGILAKGDVQQTVDVLIWGAQLELGSYISSYIPTSGGTVTRNADTGTGSGTSAEFNSEEGVLFVESAALFNDGTIRLISISDGTTDNRVFLRYNTTSNQITCRYILAAATTGQVSHTFSDSTDFHKIAFRWKVNDFSLWVDGTEVGTDTSGSVAAANTLDTFEFADGSGNSDFYGKIKQIATFDYLDDTQMANLTT